MPGTFTLDDSGVVLTQPATPVAVCKFDPTQTDDESRYRLLPNVVCDHISHSIGATPSVARFHYLFDNAGLYPDWPSQFDDTWPQTARSSQYVVVTDDRIAVIAWTPQGERRLLFDGYAQIPQVDLSGPRQAVSFVASGAEIRAWDVPIGGRKQRDGDDAYTGSPIQTDLPVRFNPSDGKGGVLPNCTPLNKDVLQDSPEKSYPVFLEENIERDPDPRSLWSVNKVARYILSVHNDGKYVRNPSMDDLKGLLIVKEPNPPDGTINPDDESTFIYKEAPVRDLDISNQPWPEALAALVHSIGFGFYFGMPKDSGASDTPTTDIYFFRYDESAVAVKTILLDDYGSVLDPGRNDTATIALARDLNHVVNAFTIETKVNRWEVSIVLAPGFTPTAGDEVPAQWPQFFNKALPTATSTIARKYRWYVADECGDGHWDGSTFVTGAGHGLDLSKLFPDDDDGNPTYVRRYRKGSQKLLTLDDSKHPRKAMLHYSQDYAGIYPAVWDGTGTWNAIALGWTLLEKRLGIRVDVDNPEQWHTGTNDAQIKGITWQANPPTGKRFWLMLTTVIDDDAMLTADVPKRVASPTRFERRRRVDARDHYQFQRVYAPSMNNKTGGAKITVRDDTDKALSLGRQHRSAHEMPPLSGTVVIPYITNYYGLSDKVSVIEGRGVQLHSNAASDQGEAKRYASIVKINWTFEGDRQTTTLYLSDLRAEVRHLA